MSDKEPLESKILKELERTGYPTEIVSASVLQQHDWSVIHNPSYLDDYERRSREVDIWAGKTWKGRINKDFGFGLFLICECKKSEKPWVFFTTPEVYDRSDYSDFIKTRTKAKNIFYSNIVGNKPIIDKEALLTYHHYFQVNRRARTFYEPLKGQEHADHSQMIYSAVSSATKAVLFHSRGGAKETFVGFYYPIVIFSGNMFEAQVDAHKNVTLSRTEYLQLSFHYVEPHDKSFQAPRETDHEFIVDIVHESYLEQFLEKLNLEAKELGNLLKMVME